MRSVFGNICIESVTLSGFKKVMFLILAAIFMSSGRATYTMEFKHYAEAPRAVAEAVIADKTK